MPMLVLCYLFYYFLPSGIKAPVDLVIALDATVGIHSDSSSRTKELIKNLMKSYNISTKDTNIGFVTFGSTAKRVVPLVSGTSTGIIEKALVEAGSVVGPRKASNALRRANDMLLNPARSDRRRDATRQVVLVMLGDNDEADNVKFSNAASKMKTDDVSLLIFALDVKNDVSLKDAVKDKDDVIKVDDSRNMKEILGKLEQRSGKAASNIILTKSCSYIRIATSLILRSPSREPVLAKTRHRGSSQLQSNLSKRLHETL